MKGCNKLGNAWWLCTHLGKKKAFLLYPFVYVCACGGQSPTCSCTLLSFLCVDSGVDTGLDQQAPLTTFDILPAILCLCVCLSICLICLMYGLICVCVCVGAFVYICILVSSPVEPRGQHQVFPSVLFHLPCGRESHWNWSSLLEPRWPSKPRFCLCLTAQSLDYGQPCPSLPDSF